MQYRWIFTEQELKEIQLANHYAQHYSHETPEKLHYTIIAKFLFLMTQSQPGTVTRPATTEPIP